MRLVVDLFLYSKFSRCEILQSDFAQTDKFGNIVIIANFLFLCICSFVLNLQHMMSVNVKLDISGCNIIAYQGCRCNWFSSILME